MNNRMTHPGSERGIALIVVLLLMMVLSGLATGFALTGQVEVQMATNEMNYAGARAAAEAGLNRALVAIFADTTTNWISGTDGAVDITNANAPVNADNGSLTFLLGNGPYYVDTAQRFSYEVQILDDDNDLLYETGLNATQRTNMGEDGSPYTNINDRVVLRATGYGPNGTTIRLARIIETVDSVGTTTTNTAVLSNPAILVNGDLTISGNATVNGTSGSVHANGNLGISGNPSISRDATSSGTFSSIGNPSWGGQRGGGRPTINVPNIQASDYLSLADYKLASNGQIQAKNGSGVWTQCTTLACNSSGWTFGGGNWSLSGNSTSSGTYYAEGGVTISGNHSGAGNTNMAFSVIATGSITISGNQKFTPANSLKIQFVTDKDFTMSGNQDLDDTTTVEGQIMVREQISSSGNTEFQGRVIVQNQTSTGGVSSNTISGNPTFTYNGTLGAISTITIVTTSGAPTYVNNVSGWMEQ